MATAAKVTVLTGGSFQGKSLVALRVASCLSYSAVISTDTVRNLLKVVRPTASYLATSTYLMDPEQLNIQISEVSNSLWKMQEIYDSRGERIIIEGMHLSASFMRQASQAGFNCFCLDNMLPFEQRVILKSITRSRLRMAATGMMDVGSDESPKFDVQATSYVEHRERIEAIHADILRKATANNFVVISYRSIDEAVNTILDSL